MAVFFRTLMCIYHSRYQHKVEPNMTRANDTVSPNSNQTGPFRSRYVNFLHLFMQEQVTSSVVLSHLQITLYNYLALVT